MFLSLLSELLASIQVCPSAAEVLEVYIFLSEPCRVAQLVLGIAHGADDSTIPRSFDVRAGRTLDSMHVLLEVRPKAP
jgi:hypothetical protein